MGFLRVGWGWGSAYVDRRDGPGIQAQCDYQSVTISYNVQLVLLRLSQCRGREQWAVNKP